jgi:RNA 3'-terminal phosphate cyclase
MFDLVKMGLKAQELVAKANAEALTDADVKAIEDAGLRVVHRPTTTLQRQNSCVSAEAN